MSSRDEARMKGNKAKSCDRSANRPGRSASLTFERTNFMNLVDSFLF